MRHVHIIVAIPAIFLAACAHYVSRPLAVDTLATKDASRDDAVCGEYARRSPENGCDGATWDEAGLLAAALAYNPDLKAAKAAAATAAAAARSARVRPGPSFTLTAEYAFQSPDPSPWLLGLSSDQLIDAGGRRKARISSADIAVRAAMFSYSDTVWTVWGQIASAISDIDGAETAVALYDEIGPLRERQLAAMQRQLQEGRASTLDLGLIQDAVAKDARAGAAARANLTATRIALAGAVGISPDAFKAPINIIPLPTELPGPPSTSRASALRERADIFNAIVAYDQTEEALRAAVAAQYPQVHVGPGYTWERGLSKLPFGLTFAFPSLDFGAAGIAEAEARREEAGRRLEAAVAGANRGIDKAYADYDAATAAYILARDRTVPTARSIADQSDRALAAGAMDRVSWVNAQAGFLLAKADLAATGATLRRARIALDDALREPSSRPAVGELIRSAQITEKAK